MNAKINLGNTITLNDLVKMKELLTTHICYVHDEEHKNKIQKLGISQLDIKVMPYMEKGMIILVDKESLNYTI